MQFPKEEIKKNILAAAKDEFLKNGFENASIRTITAAAKTSKSNVYNYFPDKDALFTAVTEPALSGLAAAFETYRSRNSAASKENYSMDAQKDAMAVIMRVVFEHQDLFRLLLFHAAGSSLSRFQSDLADMLFKVLADWIARTVPEKAISDFFVRSIAGFYVETISLMLEYGVTPQQAGAHLNEFLKFVYGGWKNVLL